ncbi:hypothetical protein TNCV_4173131 [Trichonephila clavipes]|nr:hypothetical protein TNCV_4173131 [Trichonephila clavipes]
MQPPVSHTQKFLGVHRRRNPRPPYWIPFQQQEVLLGTITPDIKLKNYFQKDNAAIQVTTSTMPCLGANSTKLLD